MAYLHTFNYTTNGDGFGYSYGTRPGYGDSQCDGSGHGYCWVEKFCGGADGWGHGVGDDGSSGEGSYGEVKRQGGYGSGDCYGESNGLRDRIGINGES